MIHILWCTIRVNLFKSSHKIWMEQSGKKDIKTHVLVSTENEKKILNDYFTENNFDNEILVFNPPYTGVCLPSYKLSSTFNYSDNDIIVFASDDFLPPKSWDKYLRDKFTSGVLFVRDGYQKPDSSNMLHPAITIPIMTGDALKKMNNVIYHPSYHHMFSDCELYLTAKDLNILIDDRINDETTFTHHHYAYGKRNADNFDRLYNIRWKDDEQNWNIRKKLPVEKRIEVN